MKNFIEYETKNGNFGLRRLNPKTGKMWKAGEAREDGAIFLSYCSIIKRDGTYQERWKLPKRAIEPSIPKNIDGKRINPATGKIFVAGDVREDGYLFKTYSPYKKTNGLFSEVWLSNLSGASIFKQKLYSLRYSAKIKGLEFNLTAEYLESIYPEKGICPVFKKPMVEASVDRIDNSKGYIIGNISWMEARANRIKSDATLEEIELIYNYMKNNS